MDISTNPTLICVRSRPFPLAQDFPVQTKHRILIADTFQAIIATIVFHPAILIAISTHPAILTHLAISTHLAFPQEIYFSLWADMHPGKIDLIRE